MKLWIIVASAVLLAGCSWDGFKRGIHTIAQAAPQSSGSHNHSHYRGSGRRGSLSDVRTNTYGPGVGSDQYGRSWRHEPNLEYRPDVYGPGVGSDQYGRPVFVNPE